MSSDRPVIFVVLVSLMLAVVAVLWASEPGPREWILSIVGRTIATLQGLAGRW